MPSPEFENLLAMFKAQRSADTPTVLELRAGFDLLGEMMPIDPDVAIESIDVAAMPADRFVTAGAESDSAILYLHGGGYCIGSKASHRPLVAALAKAARIPVILPEYRLAPEDPFPAAVDDALAAYKWVLDQGFAAEKVAVSGESAGGGLTVALQIALRDAGLPLPAASAPLSPWCDITGLGEVSEVALDMDFLRPEAIGLFAENYVAEEAGRAAPLASPVGADLAGLPPMLIQAGENEILLDMGRRLAAQAKDCGVDVTLEVEPGMFHAWHLFTAIPESIASLTRVANFLRDYLS